MCQLTSTSCTALLTTALPVDAEVARCRARALEGCILRGGDAAKAANASTAAATAVIAAVAVVVLVVDIVVVVVVVFVFVVVVIFVVVVFVGVDDVEMACR
jgi:hypothetical protein